MIYTVRMTNTHRVLQASVREWESVRIAYRRPGSTLDKIISQHCSGLDSEDIVRIPMPLDQAGLLFAMGVL